MSYLSHLMVDCETLGITENSVVLSIAVVPFEFENFQSYDELYKRGFEVKFSVSDQIKNYRRTVEKDTVEWWKQQSEGVRKAVAIPSELDVDMKEGLQQLSRFIETTEGYNYKESYVWSRGCYFDFPKIESCYRQSRMKLPYNGWKIRDTRTYIDILCGRNTGKYDLQNNAPSSAAKHHALHDASLEAACLCEIYHLVSSDG